MKERAPATERLPAATPSWRRLPRSCCVSPLPLAPEGVIGRVIHQDFHDARRFLPPAFADLVILDPPYNLTKNYNGHVFQAKEAEAYTTWFDDVLSALMPLLRRTATIYACSDWQTSTLIFPVLDRHLHVRNRITWEREKGREPRRTGRTTPRIFGSAPSATITTSMSRP